MLRSSASGAAEVFRARVDNVHHGQYLVDVTSLFGNQSIENVELGALYQHPSGPEGNYVEPEVGALVLVMKPSDGSRAVCICYVQQLHATRGAKGDRPQIGPGDQVIESRDENFVAIRRGGLIEVRSTPLCQTFWLPLTNTLRDIYSNYEAKSLLGEVSWRHAALDPSRPALETEVLFTWKGRRVVEDAQQTITVRAGHVPVGLFDGASQQARNEGIARADQVVFELAVAPNGGPTVYVLRLDRAGNVMIRTQGGATFEFTGPVHVRTDSTVLWQGVGGLELRSLLTGLLLKATNLSFIATQNVLLQAANLVLSGNVSLGGSGGNQRVPLGDILVNWLRNYALTHRHDPVTGSPVGAEGLIASLSQVLSSRVRLAG